MSLPTTFVTGAGTGQNANDDLSNGSVSLGIGTYRVKGSSYQTGTVDSNRANLTLYLGDALLGTLATTAVVTPFEGRIVVETAGTVLKARMGGSNMGGSAVYVCSFSVERVKPGAL